MKSLILLILIPLASFSQEVPIGHKHLGSWVFSDEILTQANDAIDSTGGKIVFDSVAWQNDSVLSLFGMIGSVRHADRMMIDIVGDTMYTSPEIATTVCLNTCFSIDCGGCLKNSLCKCICAYSGGCESVNVAYSGDQSATIGAIIRERILISHGNEIPE